MQKGGRKSVVLGQLRPVLSAWPYVASIFATKGLALLTLPVITNHVSLSDLGRLEVVATLIELTGLIFALGLAETLFRFADARNHQKERTLAAEVAGSGLVFALLIGAFLQVMAPALHSLLPVAFDLTAFRAGLLAACLSGLIELPLAWLRLKHRPFAFFLFGAARGVMLAGTARFVVINGGSVEEIILYNALVDVGICALLLAGQIHKTGLIISSEGLMRTLRYGLPLVGAGLAMFALGTADRLFLASYVSTEELGLYAIAAKLALAAALIMEPFRLWWGAKRYAIYQGPEGARKTADIVSIGFVVLIIGATGVALAGPLFIKWFMLDTYLASVPFLHLLVGVAVLNQACSLVSLGCYHRQTGLAVMGVNLASAVTAIIGYSLLIPSHGVMGAIGATYIAFALRFALFLAVGQKTVVAPYPLGRIALLALLAATLVELSPSVEATLAYLAFGGFTALVLMLAALLSGLVPSSFMRAHPPAKLAEGGMQ